MSKQRLTSVERAGLLLLAAAMIIAAVIMALRRNPDSYKEEPAVPVAVDSLIDELDAARDSATVPPRRRASEKRRPASVPAPAPRNPLDNPF